MSSKALTRQDINGPEVLRSIEEILFQLQIGYVPVYSPPSTGTSCAQAICKVHRPIEWEPVGRDDIARMQTIIATRMKLLAKVLPDLKSVDIKDVTERPMLSNEELAQRLIGLKTLVPEVVIEGEVEEPRAQTKPGWLQ